MGRSLTRLALAPIAFVIFTILFMVLYLIALGRWIMYGREIQVTVTLPGR